MVAKLKSECSPEEWAAHAADRVARSSAGAKPMHQEATRCLSQRWRLKDSQIDLAFFTLCGQQRRHHRYLSGGVS
jgi:hypothetical protein